jgi:hypothetical protein
MEDGADSQKNNSRKKKRTRNSHKILRQKLKKKFYL